MRGINYEFTRPRCGLQIERVPVKRSRQLDINDINGIKRFFPRIDDDPDRNFHSSLKNRFNRIYLIVFDASNA